MSLGFSVFFLIFVFCLSFFYFSYLFAAVADLLLGLIPEFPTKIKNSQQTSTRSMGNTHDRVVTCIQEGNFGLGFSLNLLNIFVHISGSVDLIAVITGKTVSSCRTWCK